MIPPNENQKMFVLMPVLVMSFALFLLLSPGLEAAGPVGPRTMSPQANEVDYDNSKFGSDPVYDDKPYSAEEQIKIYGDKKAVEVVRPLFEIFRPQYAEGPFRQGDNPYGTKNTSSLQFLAFGDWRTAVAFNDNGGNEVGQIATRLNLDLDLKLTGTERIHAFVRPLDKGGNFTRHEFAGGDREGGGELELDGNIETLFFEGDVGAIYSGLAGEYASFDLPIAFGLTPYIFQNGVWVEDAFTGGAFTIAAKNSRALNISNMDFTFFSGFDKVTSPAAANADGRLNDNDLNIFGLAAFFDANEGYWEAGFGHVKGRDELDDIDYQSFTVAFTSRYGGWLSNSLRFVSTFGQDRANDVQQTADGQILLIENSLITSKPSTLVPYFNFWVGLDRPQPLADDSGLLKNTGINFETDGLTGFPKLDDTGHDTFGGAIGVSYIFNLDQQLVVEAASVRTIGDDFEPGRAAVADQVAFSIRYQRPFAPGWIVRTDAMVGVLEEKDDLAGVRLEIRRKF